MQKKYIYPVVLSLLFMGILSSCITNKQKRYLQKDDSVYEMEEFTHYKLRINDEITYYLITTNIESQALFNTKQVINNSINQGSFAYRIYENGAVYLPFIGPVKIEGLTVREAQRLLTAEFKAMVPDAEVRIALVNNYFYVLGDGGKGQHYMYKENLNIYQALAMAGDVTSIGDKKNIKIVRKAEDGTDIVKTFDLRQESVIGSEFYYVRPNDVIYIPTHSNSFFRIESFSSFVSMFVAPLSLLILVLSAFNKL